LKEIENKAQNAYPEFRGLSEEDLSSLFDEFTLVPSHLNSKGSQNPDLDCELILGEGRDVKFPILMDHPIFVDATHIGAANKSVRIALAYGALLDNTPINLGFGMFPEEEKIANKFNEKFIMQWTSQRIGNDIETLSKTKAIVISLSVTSMGRLYSIEDFLDIVDEKGALIAAEIFGPNHHLDLDTKEDLKKHIDLLREVTDYNIPVMVKIPGENVYENTKSALFGEPDAVIIDSSINPFFTLSQNPGNYGTSLIATIPPAAKAFRAEKAKDDGIKLLVSGGIRSGADVVKAIALGVDGVGISEAAAVAMGCNLCGECFEFQCEKGMVTRDEGLKSRFKWKDAGKKLANYLAGTKLELEAALDHVGVDTVKDLNEKHIAALTYDSAAISGVKLVGYDRELPMWFH
jgi:glutamate synthase domain-containing protein 2